MPWACTRLRIRSRSSRKKNDVPFFYMMWDELTLFESVSQTHSYLGTPYLHNHKLEDSYDKSVRNKYKELKAKRKMARLA